MSNRQMTIKELVWQEIKLDPGLEINLERKLINMHALAKYIAKKIKIDNIDAIISAIRRYKINEKIKNSQEVMKVIKGSRITFKNNISTIALHKNEETIKTIPKIFREIKVINHGTLRVVHSQKSVKIYFDEEYISIKDLFNKKDIIFYEKKLGEVSLELDKSSWKTQGVLHILTEELTLNKINIEEMITCIPEITFIFKEKELIKAHNVLYELLK